MGRRYGQRPSVWLSPETPAEASALDRVCFQAGRAYEGAEAKRLKAMGVYLVGGG